MNSRSSASTAAWEHGPGSQELGQCRACHRWAAVALQAALPADTSRGHGGAARNHQIQCSSQGQECQAAAPPGQLPRTWIGQVILLHDGIQVGVLPQLAARVGRVQCTAEQRQGQPAAFQQQHVAAASTAQGAGGRTAHAQSERVLGAALPRRVALSGAQHPALDFAGLKHASPPDVLAEIQDTHSSRASPSVSIVSRTSV